MYLKKGKKVKHYKIKNTNNVKYIGSANYRDEIIPSSNFEGDVLAKTTGYKMKQPFRLLIGGEVKVNGKRKRLKRVVDFPASITMKKAIDTAKMQYQQLATDTKESMSSPINTEMLMESSGMPTFKRAFNDYINGKVTRYEANNKKIPYGNFNDISVPFGEEISFCENWLKPIHDMKLDEIKTVHLEQIMASMKTDKGVPLAIRTKRKVYQTVNPVYSHILATTDHIIKTPASMKGLGKVNNERNISLSVKETKELFTELANYDHSIIRGVFMFLMHGRRLNEVLTLDWKDINFKAGTYTIRAENNKARIDMTYSITDRLQVVLDSFYKQKSGFVFPAINDESKQLSSDTVRNHWKSELHLHDLRHLIGGHLVNMGVSYEIIGAILGHTPTTGNITSRYSKVKANTASDVVTSMLDDLIVKSDDEE